MPEDGLRSVAVNLKAHGDIFILQTKALETYVGILGDSRVVSTLTGFPLRIDATLLISEDTISKQRAKSKPTKHTSAESARQYALRIVVHGLRCDKETIGDLLADADLFLQHPSADEMLPEVKYDNPHYLVRPGTEMTRPKDLQLEPYDDDKGSVQGKQEHRFRNSELLRLFETVFTDDGAVKVPNILPSLRLRSSLMR